MTDIETDFCIVGGGPAGLTLALLLTRSGARVVLLERSHSLEREYRGEILQPSGQSLLDQIGILGPITESGLFELDRFRLVENGRVLIDANYRSLPPPYNRLISVPQQHVLTHLLARCTVCEGFTYLPGCRVSKLLLSGERVVGVQGDGRSGAPVVRAHCVIGADGRYSKVRRLAGIDPGRQDAFDQDLLWFKLPLPATAPREVCVLRAGGNPVITYPSFPDSLQVGWTLPHRRYAEISAAGLYQVKEQIAAAIPPYADLVRSEITGLQDLTLLDDFAGSAPEWTRDGLVLIGDSAHAHSPIGAQGINLAIQDAVMLHPILLDSLRRADARAEFFAPYVRARRRDINRITRIQIMQGKAMLSTGRVGSVLRPRMASLVSRTPIYRKVMNSIAFGNTGIRVVNP